VETQSSTAPGVNVTIVKVDDGVAGKKPTVTFTIRDNSGAGISMAQMTGGNNRIGLVLAGPTSDYGYTNFGSDVTTHGYVSENPVPTAKCGSDGTCTYTFTHAIPADAKGTFAIGIEARRELTILPGTTKQQVTEYGAINKVSYFSVDGSAVQPRRKVVEIAKCNGCHSFLSLHGENRNQIEQCVLCHNPSETDIGRRSSATNPADKTQPPQAVNFALMIHKIHTGENMQEFGQNYTIVGFGGSHNDFSEVRYPVMGNTGETKDTAKCYMCHVNNSEAVFPVGKNNVTDPQGKLNPAPSTTSACTACHMSTSALSHAVSQTDPKFGESCDVCHGADADFSVIKEHAGK
jgi:OmcA/MtrC family decaheme c-type cytochrome